MINYENTKTSILIIDDEESIRLTFKNFLLDEGYDVKTASDFNKALTLIDKADFDLIYADIILKGKTGIDVLREVKGKNLNCPVIMITGAPDIGTASEALRLGAFDYITKPVLQETLLHATKTALQQKTLVDEKEKYRSNLEAIFKSVKDAIIMVDRDLLMIEINEAAKSICGISRDAIGKTLDFLPKHCNGKCIDTIKETVKKKQVVEIYRFECKHKHKPQQVVNITTYPLVENRGKSTGAVLVVRDETHLADLEREMKARQRYHNIIGKSGKMQEIYFLIENLASVPTTVLITGESGTGKELVAEALHYRGVRNRKPLVKVNCSALSENLLGSELFGHVKGAFTGAINDRVGRFEMADGGTIFLDEIGDISPGMQAQLLRILQERVFERIGDSKPIKVDVRVVTATHQDLMQKIRSGKFREDLYYRLRVVEVNLPSLRDRKEDIPLFVNHFLNKFNKKLNKEIKGISSEVQKMFMEYSWPGNVRELEHTLEHASILCNHKIIALNHLPPVFEEFPRAKVLSLGDQKTGEIQAILQALEKTAWNKTRAAQLLGMSRRNIYRKIKQYKIKMQDT